MCEKNQVQIGRSATKERLISEAQAGPSAAREGVQDSAATCTTPAHYCFSSSVT